MPSSATSFVAGPARAAAGLWRSNRTPTRIRDQARAEHERTGGGGRGDTSVPFTQSRGLEIGFTSPAGQGAVACTWPPGTQGD